MERMNPTNFELPFEKSGLERMDLYALLYPLWLNKWLIILTIAVSLTLGIFYICLKAPQYNSNILLQMEEKNSLLDLGNSPLNSMLPANGRSSAEVQTALIMSRYILEPVIENLSLNLRVTQAAYFPIIGSYISKLAGKANASIKISAFSIPDSLENKRFILQVTGPNKYALYDDQNQLILNGIVGQLMTHQISDRDELKIEVAHLNAKKNTRFFVVKQSLQLVMNGLVKKLDISDLSQEMKLRSNTGILKVNFVDSHPDFVVKVLNEIAKTVTKKNIEKKLMEAQKTITFIKTELPKAKESLDQAERKLNLYFAKEGMLDIRSQSKLLMQDIANTQKSLNSLDIKKKILLQKYTIHHPFYLAFHEKEKILTSKLKSLQHIASQLPTRDQFAMSLMRDVSVKSQLYLLLLKKIQSLEVIQGGTVGDITILGFASKPTILPKGAPSTLLFSFLFGFVLGALLIYLHRLLNQNISDPAVVEKQFGLTNMAIVPFSPEQQKMLNKSDQKTDLLPLLAKVNPKDLSIEALRSFRTGLQFSMLNAANNRIMISGITPGVGKSFVSVNFAYLLADSGKKVLLIDADLRKGHLKDYFCPELNQGLSDIICGTTSAEEVLFSNEKGNLSFIPTGSYPPNPSELLLSPAFQKLLETLSREFDLVVIDTPPILPVTDAAVIAQYTSAKFLVLGSNMHSADEIELALKRFQTNGCKINGTVFNFSKPQKHFYRYNSEYKYQYQY